MIYSNNFSVPTRIPHSQHRNHSLLVEKEAKACDANDRLLLPSSTRSVKRRISLLEKSRDWARRLITLHKPRRNTLSNEPNRTPFAEASKRSPPEIKPCSSSKQLHNAQKNFDEDGYLSPLEIKAKLDTIKRPAPTHPSQVTLSEPSHAPPVAKSQVIYRYHDPNISTPLPPPACVCPIGRRTPRTSFVSEFQKSLSIVDYIDDDVPDEIVKHDDDPLHSLKYLFDDERTPGSALLPRRIPRRSTNVSSISTDSGYSDVPVSTTPKLIPIHLVSCTLLPVNPSAHDPMNARCFTCSCRPASSLSTTCLANHADRRVSPPTTRSYLYRQTLTHLSPAENGIATQCTCTKYHSTMTIYPPPLPPLPMSKNPAPKLNEYKEDYYQRPQKQRDNKRTTAKRRPNTADDLSSISRWYKPNLEREEVCDALQQADYGTFILRKSTTHADCYALSIKVPKFTHESNIVHYLIEKTMVNQAASYRIKGTVKQFPTLLSLLTHHSVMPEILPITLNLNESFSI